MRMGIAICGCFLTVLSLSGCTDLFLQPDRIKHATPEQVGGKWAPIHFASRDGTDLWGLWLSARGKDPRGVVLQFHGNGENASSHFLFVHWLTLEGWDVMAFDYRGYGGSAGSPSLSGSVEDGVAALAWARQRAGNLPLVVIGQSLGGAIALAALDRDGGSGVRALVLDSSFASYRGVAAAKIGEWSWLRPVARALAFLLVSDQFAPERLLSRRNPIPLVVMHGEGDPIVPLAQGRRLYDLAPGPKEFWLIPGTGHIEALGRLGTTYRPKLARWLDSVVGAR